MNAPRLQRRQDLQTVSAVEHMPTNLHPFYSHIYKITRQLTKGKPISRKSCAGTGPNCLWGKPLDGGEDIRGGGAVI